MILFLFLSFDCFYFIFNFIFNLILSCYSSSIIPLLSFLLFHFLIFNCLINFFYLPTRFFLVYICYSYSFIFFHIFLYFRSIFSLVFTSSCMLILHLLLLTFLSPYFSHLLFPNRSISISIFILVWLLHYFHVR
jgi:hypothetical protein